MDQASGATGVKEEQGAASTSPIEDFLTADNVSEYGRRTHTEEEIVKYLKTLIAALGVTMVLPMAARSADKTATQSAETLAAPAKCLEAVVNPVTGYAFWVNPRGAQVEPPPRASLNRMSTGPVARWIQKPEPAAISARYPAPARAERSAPHRGPSP